MANGRPDADHTTRPFEEPAQQVRRKLAHGQAVPLAELVQAGKPVMDALGDLVVTGLDGTKVSAVYRFMDGDQERAITTEPEERDLADGPITVGRLPGDTADDIRPDNTITVPSDIKDPFAKGKAAAVSRKQGELCLIDGVPHYRHLSKSAISHPLRTAPQEERIPAEGQSSGGGYTHENADRNPRESNEDRGIAHRGPALKRSGACSFLKRLINDDLVPATRGGNCGSTLSMAMRTKEGQLACAFVGDAPIYLIAQHPKTEEIRLVQVTMPHNTLGHKIRWAMEARGIHATRKNMDAQLEALGMDEYKRYAAMEHLPSSLAPIYRALGRGHDAAKNLTESDPTPEIYAVDPGAEIPEGFTYRGALVCSDGIEPGVRSGRVQKALQPLFAGGAEPSPQQVCKTAVLAARPRTDDNITAMMLPAKGRGGDLIAVADGNSGSADVADIIVERIRERVQSPVTDMLDQAATIRRLGNNFRISLAADDVMPTHQRMEWLGEGLRGLDPQNAYQMGIQTVRNTMTVNNPPNAVRDVLVEAVRDKGVGM